MGRHGFVTALLKPQWAVVDSYGAPETTMGRYGFMTALRKPQGGIVDSYGAPETTMGRHGFMTDLCVARLAVGLF
jgi:hypothetical protein